MAHPRPKRDSQEVIEGRRAIAKYMGRSPRTVYQWWRFHGFPMGRLPSGSFCTTPELISRWIQVRGQLELQELGLLKRTPDHEVPAKEEKSKPKKYKIKRRKH